MDNKKLLFVVGRLYPNMDANSGIAYKLANKLKDEYHYDIVFLGRYKQKNISKDIMHPFKTYTLNNLDCYKRFMKHKVVKYVSLCINKLFKSNKSNLAKEANYYLKAINKIIVKENIKCIVCFSQPLASQLSSVSNEYHIPVISYKLDHDSSYLYSIYGDSCNKSINEEKQIIAKSNAIIAPPVFFNKLKKDYPNQDNIYCLDFPNIQKYSFKPHNNMFNDTKHIHCTFVGNLYKDIRNPQYVIDLFKQLNKENIILHFIGGWYGKKQDFNLPNNVIFHDAVDTDTSLLYMNDADILVNIGNSVPELVPSKLLTYISLGKPILNFIKLTDCPTLSYTNRYPLVLDILETDIPNKEDISKVKDFILSNKDKTVPYSYIEKEYKTNTLEYVGEQLNKIINL